MFFCTPSESPLRFRRAKIEEYLGSPTREIILGSIPEREVPLESVLGKDLFNAILGNETDREAWEKVKKTWLITDANNMLGQWQESSAVEHWKSKHFLHLFLAASNIISLSSHTVMRGVLPHDVWEAY